MELVGVAEPLVRGGRSYRHAVHVAADNAKAAAALVTRFKKLAVGLARAPGIGRGRPELRPDLRSHTVGRYVIFYRPTRGGIRGRPSSAGAVAGEDHDWTPIPRSGPG